MTHKHTPKNIDNTATLRRHILENPNLKTSKTTCIGCGGGFTPPNHPNLRGTSRWNPKARLCTACCELEALSGLTDPFGLSILPGGRGA